MRLFLWSTALYTLMAAVVAFDTAFASARPVQWFGGLVWLRVHLVTLGILVQGGFGLILATLPDGGSGEGQGGVAGLSRLGRPGVIWLGSNSGLLVLLAGTPSRNVALMGIGGTLLILTTTLLMAELMGRRRMVHAHSSGDVAQAASRAVDFYLAGAAFLLFGAFVGAFLWSGLPVHLGMASPKEIHIHANTWGFAAFVLAGWVIGLAPRLFETSIAQDGALRRLLLLLVAGNLLLIAGPWLGMLPVMAAGILLHFTATLWLMLQVVRRLRTLPSWTPGAVHLATGYGWLVVLALAAPILVFSGTDLRAATVEATAPQLLIYGWVLQVCVACMPRAFAVPPNRELSGGAPSEPQPNAPYAGSALGGSWASVLTLNAGVPLVGASVVFPTAAPMLYAVGYSLWGAGLLAFFGRLIASGLSESTWER